MKYFFTLLSCLACGPVFAEMIQNVEYQLPKEAENWVVGNKLEGKRGTTILYIPQGVDRKDTKESFGVNSNTLSTNPKDIQAIKAALIAMFPNADVEFHILEKDDTSVIYEWAIQEGGEEKMHGWGRDFSSPTGSVFLGYQTENISDVPQARSRWLPVLRDAKQRSP